MLELLIDQRAAIQARMRELDWLRRDERLVELSSPGEGNMNRTLRADLGGRSLILKQSTSFVVKYPEIPAPAERIEVEAAFYKAASHRQTKPQLLRRVIQKVSSSANVLAAEGPNPVEQVLDRVKVNETDFKSSSNDLKSTMGEISSKMPNSY